jgi:murein DD-endopeptidase MepM/ murein hydrolase activator NlpD
VLGVAVLAAVAVALAVAFAGPGAPLGGPPGGPSGGALVGGASGDQSGGGGAASTGAGDLAAPAPAARARGETAESSTALAGAAGGRAVAAPPPAPSGAGAPRDGPRWRWPLFPRPPVLRKFLAPLTDYGRGHRGIDLAAEVGAPVLAVDGGVVTHAGVVAGRGTVTVRHPGGLSSTYEPVSPGVVVGSRVAAGEVLGTVGARAGPAHCGARACLHLGARRGGAYLDPLPLLAGGRVALLPLG